MINGFNFPTEIWLPLYTNLDLSTQAALEVTACNAEVTTLAALVPLEEREVMTAIVKEKLFNRTWELETNPEIKQKIAAYRNKLEKVVRKDIRCQKDIKN